MPCFFDEDVFEGEGERDNNNDESEDSSKDVSEGDGGDLAQRPKSSISLGVSSVSLLASESLSHDDRVVRVEQGLYHSSSESLIVLPIPEAVRCCL